MSIIRPARVATALVAAVLAVGGLTACSSEPDVSVTAGTVAEAAPPPAPSSTPPVSLPP